MKKLMLTAALAMFAFPVHADHLVEGDSFYGNWWLSGQTQGDMVLGDGNGYGLVLGTTPRYCVRRGKSYSVMRSFIRDNYPDGVSWYVDEVCRDGYVRVCVFSYSGAKACSTYVDYGWRRF